MAANNSVQQVLDAMNLTEAERLSQLYLSIQAGAISSEDDKRNAEQQGGSIFRNAEARLRASICRNERIQRLAKSGAEDDRVTLILLTVDIVITLFSGPAVFLITAQLLSRGLGKLCAEEWQDG